MFDEAHERTLLEKVQRLLNPDHAMHTVVLSCTRARKQTLAAPPLSKAVLR